MDGVNMFIPTPLFCKKFVALRTVLDPLWKRLKCSFWLFFLFEIFSTWSQDCNLSEKSLSQNDIANSSNVLVWLVTRSDLVSHHTSLHKQACNIRREWVIGSEGHVLPWNFVYLEYQCDNCKRSLKNKNNLDSHQSSTHAALNYSFVSKGINPTVWLWIF